MENKSLTDLLKIAKAEDVDEILLEYMLVLVGAKKTLENLKEFISSGNEDLISRAKLLDIIDNENIDINM